MHRCSDDDDNDNSGDDSDDDENGAFVGKWCIFRHAIAIAQVSLAPTHVRPSVGPLVG